MDNGFRFQKNAVAVRDGSVFLHSATLDGSGRVILDDALSRHPPHIAHFAIGDFDFTLITLHLTFQEGDTQESVRELRNILDFLDAYFYTPGHDPDVIITGDFNAPSQLSGEAEDDGLAIDGVLAVDLRFQAGERRFVVTVHEKTSRKANGEPNENYDHFILSADCLEEFIRNPACGHRDLDGALRRATGRRNQATHVRSLPDRCRSCLFRTPCQQRT